MNAVAESKLKGLIGAVLGADPAAIVDELRPGQIPGWDSLGHLSLVSELERQFGFTMTMEESLGINSIADVKAVLARHGVTVTPG